MNEEIILEKEMFYITYFDEKELSFKEHYETYKNIKNEILSVLNKYNIKFVLAETEIINDLQEQNTELKDNWNKLKEWLEDTIEQYGGFAKYRFESVYNKMQEIEGEMNE